MIEIDDQVADEIRDYLLCAEDSKPNKKKAKVWVAALTRLKPHDGLCPLFHCPPATECDYCELIAVVRVDQDMERKRQIKAIDPYDPTDRFIRHEYPNEIEEVFDGD